jgi:hypothetical protein
MSLGSDPSQLAAPFRCYTLYGDHGFYFKMDWKIAVPNSDH